MAKYTSRKKELCIVVRPEDRTMDEQRRIMRIPGKRAEFFNYHYETLDPEIIECLRTHAYRNKKFIEITEEEQKLMLPQEPAVPVVDGAMSTAGGTPIVEEVAQVEATTRPGDTTAISPELIRIIDERVNSALMSIVDLLKKDEVREEKIMSDKPTKKTFKCPYCGEPQKSGFAVGKHKKVCPKRPQ